MTNERTNDPVDLFVHARNLNFSFVFALSQSRHEATLEAINVYDRRLHNFASNFLIARNENVF